MPGHRFDPSLFIASNNEEVRVQRASEGFHYGDTNAEHVLGVSLVSQFLKKRKFTVVEPYPVRYSDGFKQRNKGCPDGWAYDIAGFKPTDLDPYYLAVTAPDIIVEVDGEKHDKTAAKINDGMAEKYAWEKWPACKFVRIKKQDCCYENWIRKKLGID